MFAAIIAVCSWITLPLAVPFTLQTLGVFLAVGVMGGKYGSISVLVYIILGASGLPVFSSFTGGAGVLLGQTGGFIWGFLIAALIMWLFEVIFKGFEKTWVLAAAMFVGLVAVYTSGTLWYMAVYLGEVRRSAVFGVLGKCVFPFIIPDTAKIVLAVFLSKRLRTVILR